MHAIQHASNHDAASMPVVNRIKTSKCTWRPKGGGGCGKHMGTTDHAISSGHIKPGVMSVAWGDPGLLLVGEAMHTLVF